MHCIFYKESETCRSLLQIRGDHKPRKRLNQPHCTQHKKYCLLLFFPLSPHNLPPPCYAHFVLGMRLLQFWFHYNPRMCITWTQCVSFWAAPICVWAPQDTRWSEKWAVREKTLQIMSSPLSSFFFFFLGPNQLIFPPKWCHVCLGLICHLWVLDRPHLKVAVGPIYGSQPIELLYFIGPWTLDSHLKWP